MKRQPLDLPSDVARGFAEAMNDYFAEPDTHERNAIALHQQVAAVRRQAKSKR